MRASVYLLVHFHENLYEDSVLAAVLFSALIMLEANVYIFIASDMGRVALINIRCGKFFSGLCIPQAEIFFFFLISLQTLGLPPLSAIMSFCPGT